MIKLLKNKYVLWAIAALYAFAATYFIKNEEYYLWGLPFVLPVIWAVVFHFEKLMLALIFLVPVSFQLSEVVSVKLPIDMFLPSELLIVGILILFILKFFHGQYLDKKFLLHPVSLIIWAYLMWMFISTVQSYDILVSVKLFINRVWFIVVFYIIMGMMFIKRNINRKYMRNYIYGLCLVATYAMVRIITEGGVDEKIAHWSANPFFKDHTSYGAVLAMFIPAALGLAFYKGYSKIQRWIFLFISAYLFLALVYSYSRAAWLSLILAAGVWAILKLRIHFVYILSAVGIIALIAYHLSNDNVMYSLMSNDQDSSDNFSEHVVSAANVSTDASNLERLNRWSCAIRMFLHEPLFGFGPGNYTKYYAPFQYSTDLTIISTRHGDVGNAHSEYLSALSEQGWPGLLMLLMVIGFTLYYGICAIKLSKDSEMRMLGYAAIVGLITYYFHGLFNNFLDIDKVAVPFWGFTAMLVAIDIYYRNPKEENSEQTAINE